METRKARLAIYTIFFLSGATGLMYEVVWARQLVLVFGNTTQAVSAILTGFFGGLAIGALLGGRIADRVRRPLQMYGILELALVGVVLLTPTLFRALHEVYRAGYASLENAPTRLALVRYGLALLALAPATILMGATLPTLSRRLSRSGAELGHTFARLYAVNTAGAVTGTFVAGIFLIELLGLTGTLVVGAIGSGLAGIAAIVLDRFDRVAHPALPESPAPIEATSSMRRVSIVVASVSGLTSLGYQILWTRLLASGTGNTTYVFTVILVIFLVGITVGADVIAKRMGRVRSPVAVIGAIQILTAALALFGLVDPQQPVAFLAVLFPCPDRRPASHSCLGCHSSAPVEPGRRGRPERRSRCGRDPRFQYDRRNPGHLRRSVPAHPVDRLYPLARGPGPRQHRRRAVPARTRRGAAFRGTPPHARYRRDSGVLAAAGLAFPTPLTRDPGVTSLVRRSALLGEAEDEIAAVQAGGVESERRLFVTGTSMTILTVDAKLMAYLPIITRPESRRMLVIAFGMGSTYRAGLRAGLSVDGVELVPSVPKMFQLVLSGRRKPSSPIHRDV